MINIFQNFPLVDTPLLVSKSVLVLLSFEADHRAWCAGRTLSCTLEIGRPGDPPRKHPPRRVNILLGNHHFLGTFCKKPNFKQFFWSTFYQNS